MNNKTILITAILISFFTSQVVLGAAGKISGKVTDQKTGDAVAGANLIIQGTSIATISDLDGQYLIANVPVGSYLMKATYIGYNSVEYSLEVIENEKTVQNVIMNAVSDDSQEVHISAQTIAQNEVINQHLTSGNIVDVVSLARIQEIPDANVTESIGRLPGVSLLRTGGQATQLVIRGLNPEYNQITIAGVPIPANESYRSSLEGREELGGGRGVDMRVIPSDALNNITVYKTYTPDMDAAFVGGMVDLGIRKAGKSLPAQPFGLSYIPAFSMQTQGGYTDITNEYNNYKFDLTLEKRFFNDRFGIFAQGMVQQQNQTWDRLNADYVQNDQINALDNLALTNLDLQFYPRTETTYNGTLTLDYEIPYGNLVFTNIFSQNKTKTDNFSQQYAIGQGCGNYIYYSAGREPNELNLITNILKYNQKSSLLNIDATFSHSYSENISPDTWTVRFDQISAGTDNITETRTPEKTAELAYQQVIMNEMNLRYLDTNDRFTRQRELRGAIDFSRDFHIKDIVSLELKAGGMYSYTDRTYDYNRGFGYIWFGHLGENIVEKYPWLEDEYGISTITNPNLYITPFLDPDRKIGTYLEGDYTFDNQLDLDLMEEIKEIIIDYGRNPIPEPVSGEQNWKPSMFRKAAYDYSADEHRVAEYLMGTFNIGQMVKIIAGVRYQNLTTRNRANRFYNADFINSYPFPYAGRIDTTFEKSHGYWLPAVHLKYNPLPWFSAHGAYTKTLAYPNFRAIIPIINVYIDEYNGKVDWNNVSLKPARSKNFDLQLSAYNNTLGLFTIGGFLKHIDDFVFWKSAYINDPADYEGLHDVAQYPNLDVRKYSIATYYNNPDQVKVWGIETDWQHRFWYLPAALKGLVFDVNYTHVFSEATYPKVFVSLGSWPDFQITYIDSTYTDRLINQPEDIVNVSLGYDYKDFSILLSMNYQSGIFTGTDFYNALRSDKENYLRLDLAARQKLPWYNIEMFLNVYNLTDESDEVIMRGNGYPTSEDYYGLSAKLGFRVSVY